MRHKIDKPITDIKIVSIVVKDEWERGTIGEGMKKKIASDTDMCRRTGPLCPAAAVLGCVLCVCSSRSLLAFYA